MTAPAPVCSSRKSQTFAAGLLPPVSLALTGVWALVENLSPLQRMNLIAGSLYLLIKLHLLLLHLQQYGSPGRLNILLWFAGWPGMDFPAFLARRPESALSGTAPHAGTGMTNIIGGVFLLCLVAPALVDQAPEAAAWCAIAGILLVVHFGLLHLLAVFWQQRGRHVLPIMNAPLLATSLSDFWSHRWNRAFRDYTHTAVFRPLSRRWSANTGLLGAFLFSGLIHELSISAPAGGGWGAPLLYFVIQAIGVQLERRLQSHSSWQQPLAGRLLTTIVVIGPLPLLFHSAFRQNIILPLIALADF